MIDKIAQLAKLDFSPSEKERLTKDFEEIVGYIDALKEVNTDGIQPTMHLHEQAHDNREDMMQPWFSPKKAVRNTPHHKGGYFTVPKVIK